ncbi:hypothetical protein F4805DRAFT_456407 [Annulohypoxylon moriforme]|nr:hypothetical protein F4805DRAFT_456407 [Annulohypoxylon moriforme]
MSTIMIILALAPLALAGVLIDWPMMLFSVFQALKAYLGKRISNITPMALATIVVYCSAPLFEYSILLVWSYALIGLVDQMAESVFRIPIIVLILLVSYVQFWKYIGRAVILVLAQVLLNFLREYRWKRFINCTLYTGEYNFESRVIIYLADWIHSRVIGDWKMLVLFEFRSRQYPGPQPILFSQLQRRFLGEVKVLAGIATSPNPEVGVAAADILGMPPRRVY